MAQKVSALPIGVSKVRFSFRKHIVPPMVGILATLFIYGLLNYPYVSSRAQYYWNQFHPPVFTSQSSNSVAVNPDLSQIIIPSISVKAPVIYESSVNNNIIAYDLRSGVVHYGNTAMPGQNGNAVIFGHSSGVSWAPGDYKFVFTLLEKMHAGQQISLDYKGVRYVYIVTDTEVVAPTDMSVLKSNGTAQLSLITCTPVGTSKNRLVVHASQLSPNPSKNAPFQPSGNTSLKEIPAGN
jgi:sortase A